MTEDTKGSLKMVAGGLIILIIITIWGVKSRKNIGENIRRDPSYAIGVFQSAISGGPRYSNTSINISFETNGIKWNITSKGKIGNYEQAKKGDKYLVVYNLLDPNECSILFDYPIRDSTDFKRFLEEFKIKPLDIEKYF